MEEDFWDSFFIDDGPSAYPSEPPRRRGRAKNYSGDGVTNVRMSQTEVALRVAAHLAKSPSFAGPVFVKLGGVEANRGTNDTAFPVATYLSRWGFSKDRLPTQTRPGWVGLYSNKVNSRKLLLGFDRFDPIVHTRLAAGRRIVVHCWAGNVTDTRSPAEVHDLNRAIGRAVGWKGTLTDDVIAVCIPRSERFRKLAAEKATSVGAQRAGLMFLHVDRGGTVSGFKEGTT
jgi:hypothetical protein